MNSTLAIRAAEIRQEIKKVIVGQETLIEKTLIALLAGGHVILEGVPGLAKTLFARALAASLQVSFKRIQFTPDLMPSDIVGTNVIEEDHTTGKRVMVFVAGPIFTNVLLADNHFLDFLPDLGSTTCKGGVHAMADLISTRSRATLSQPEGGRPSL